MFANVLARIDQKRILETKHQKLEEMRDRLFAPLSGFPLYDPITLCDVADDLKSNGVRFEALSSKNTEFSTRIINKMSDDRLDLFYQIKRLMPDAKVELWEQTAKHFIGNEEVSCIKRYGFVVVIQFGALEIARKYAAPNPKPSNRKRFFMLRQLF